MGDDNIDVGNNPARKPGRPIVQRLLESNGSTDARIDRQNLKRAERPICGAMSQQGSEFRGNVSAPQKFVHLVGCRERKAGADLETRQYSNPVKR